MDMHGDSQTNDSCLSEARKKTTREDYIEAFRGEFVDALAALEEIQVAQGFLRESFRLGPWRGLNDWSRGR